MVVTQKNSFHMNNLIYPWINLPMHFIQYRSTQNRGRNLEVGNKNSGKTDNASSKDILADGAMHIVIKIFCCLIPTSYLTISVDRNSTIRAKYVCSRSLQSRKKQINVSKVTATFGVKWITCWIPSAPEDHFHFHLVLCNTCTSARNLLPPWNKLMTLEYNWC